MSCAYKSRAEIQIPLSSLAGLEDMVVTEVLAPSGLILEAATLETDLGALDVEEREEMIGSRRRRPEKDSWTLEVYWKRLIEVT